MTPELLGILVAGMLGSGGIVAVVSAWSSRKEVDANAMQTWSTVWNENLQSMRIEVNNLRERVTALETELDREQAYSHRLIQQLTKHNIPLPE
jgi:hypothetical protein